MPKNADEKKYSVASQLIHGRASTTTWDYSHHVNPPITASTTYRLETAERGATGFGRIGSPDESQPPIYVYPRMGDPNVDMLQHALAAAEGGECCVTFASGMAAIHGAVGTLVGCGDEIISHPTVYGCTYSLFSSQLARFGVKTHFVDLSKSDLLEKACSPKTKIIYLESPVNPTLELLDVEAIVRRVREINAKRPPEAQILTIMDNTFATPFAQRPIQMGVDIVIHSLTKGISGFGAVMGGAVITRKEFQERLILFRKDFGGIILPSTAWSVLHYGISTLNFRIPHLQKNALKVAEYLETQPMVERVRYPGLPSFPQHELAKRLLRDYEGQFAPGFMIYFTLKGSSPEEQKKRGEALMNYLAKESYVVTLAVSLGQLRTLVEHPGSMTHAAYPAEQQVKRGIDPGGIRLSVGAEPHKDIIKDLEAALGKLG